MNDGTIEWDGKRGLYDEEGKLIRVATDENGITLGYGESLLEYMGRENAESWLSEQGHAVAGLSDSELGDGLMSYLLLQWAASGVQVDPNMGELMDTDYATARNAWLGKSYQIVRGGDGETYIDYGGVIAPGFEASQSVLDQVSLRDGIIADMTTFENAIANGHGSPTALGDFAMNIRERQTEYNQQYVKSGMAFTPENFISQEFRNELNRYQLSDGSYISYVHSGIDTVGNSQMVSPGFMEVVDIPAAYQRDYGEVFGLIGTDVHFRGLHMDPNQLGQIDAGMTFGMGENIANFGMWGPTGGPHFHLEATTLNQSVTRGFVDPLIMGGTWYPGSDFWGRYEELLPNGLYRTIGGWPSTYPR
jgi:hypothetical protein